MGKLYVLSNCSTHGYGSFKELIGACSEVFLTKETEVSLWLVFKPHCYDDTNPW